MDYNQDMQSKPEPPRFVWKVENNTLEPIPVKLNFNNGEICVFTNPLPLAAQEDS